MGGIIYIYLTSCVCTGQKLEVKFHVSMLIRGYWIASSTRMYSVYVLSRESTYLNTAIRFLERFLFCLPKVMLPLFGVVIR